MNPQSYNIFQALKYELVFPSQGENPGAKKETGGNGEQRKGLKGKRAELLTKSKNYSKINLFRCFSGDLEP